MGPVMSKVPNSELSRDVGHSWVSMCPDDARVQARESQQNPPQAFNRTVRQLYCFLHCHACHTNTMQGTIAMMATVLLCDPQGKIIPHQVQHDLESHLWTALFGLINCQGPFHNIVQWPANTVVAGTTGDINGVDVELLPPSWLRPRAGQYPYTFEDIFVDRIRSLGNWEYYRSLIQPYWRDNVILDGMGKMFDIFMSKNMLISKQQWHNKITIDPAFNKCLVHDQLIDIVKEIITGINGISDMDHMYYAQLPLPHVLIKDGRHLYTSNLQFSQLPPLDEPDNDLLDAHPANVITPTHATTRRRHTRSPSVNRSAFYPSSVTPHPPGPPMTVGGNPRRSPQERPSVDDGGASLPSKKRRIEKGKETGTESVSGRRQLRSMGRDHDGPSKGGRRGAGVHQPMAGPSR